MRRLARFATLVLMLCLGGNVLADAEIPPPSVYTIFTEAIDIAQRGKVPLVFLDIDDTLIRTAFRYLDVIDELHQRFGIFPSWSKVRSPDWPASHHMSPNDIVYADSFEKTLRLTLEKLITDTHKLEEMYHSNEKGIPLAMQVFFEVFFDTSRVAKDAMFPDSVYFLNNLLNLMKTIGGKVVFLSGRADKYLDVTQKALMYNGVNTELLKGAHVLWYLKPSSGKINFSEDTQLDFRNDKSGMVTSILSVDHRFEVAGFVDNETRNIFSLVGHDQIQPKRLYFFRSVDATWREPIDGELIQQFLDRIQYNPHYFAQFGTFRVTLQQAKDLKALLNKHGFIYLTDSTHRSRQPTEATHRQLTLYNEADLSMIHNLVCP